MAKQIAFSEDARRRLKKGVDTLADAVMRSSVVAVCTDAGAPSLGGTSPLQPIIQASRSGTPIQARVPCIDSLTMDIPSNSIYTTV